MPDWGATWRERLAVMMASLAFGLCRFIAFLRFGLGFPFPHVH
jgi:hypothetical protein